jgi:hypothetical protein
MIFWGESREAIWQQRHQRHQRQWEEQGVRQERVQVPRQQQ